MKQNQTASLNKSLVPIIAASSAGTLIEWYDFYIFGSLATIISTQFFPKENATTAFLATLATFAAGLVVRPFGALFFGRLGDMIGRKYTFMLTMLLMGGSTFAIGLVPSYDTIGFIAPILVLILRLLQGLAIGGEYGGAATYVAEHSPVHKRGFWTSWIQGTIVLAFMLSLTVILLTKNSMNTKHWEAWGWRIPFLLSALLVVVSVYIRKNMAESPLFTKAKEAGKTSSNPLKESFGTKANLKVVLLALVGLLMGMGVVGWAGILYVQTFLLKFMFIEYEQANTVIIIALLFGCPLYILFGWLSDKVGRKNMIMLSLFLSVVSFRSIFKQLYLSIDLEQKVENTSALKIEINRQFLSVNDSTITTTTQRFYTDGTTYRQVQKETTSIGKIGMTAIEKTIHITSSDKWKLVGLIFLLLVILTMSYGPLAAFLVEMFPLKIRYTSMSLPFHLGYGIFGGMAPVIATYLISKAKDAGTAEYYLAGLNYPIVVAGISLVIGLLYLKEKSGEQAVVKAQSNALVKLKKYLGIVWILLGLMTAFYGIVEVGLPKIRSGNPDDLIFGIIAMIIITPVATFSLVLFGIYALQGAYDQ
ncbi:MAG: MFS transporter [Chitinophagaceae bacterium]|nr:MFS transporter [Chitinophagaceae bacterium]